MLPLGRFDRIGRFETLDADLGEILSRIFGPGGGDNARTARAGPRSDAGAAMVSHYDDATLAAVGRLCAADLVAFGYAPPVLAKNSVA